MPAGSATSARRAQGAAGHPDHVPLHDSRLGRALAMEYGLPGGPLREDLVRISEGWRPYRSWVALLLRVRLEMVHSTMPP